MRYQHHKKWLEPLPEWAQPPVKACGQNSYTLTAKNSKIPASFGAFIQLLLDKEAFYVKPATRLPEGYKADKFQGLHVSFKKFPSTREGLVWILLNVNASETRVDITHGVNVD